MMMFCSVPLGFYRESRRGFRSRPTFRFRRLSLRKPRLLGPDGWLKNIPF